MLSHRFSFVWNSTDIVTFGDFFWKNMCFLLTTWFLPWAPVLGIPRTVLYCCYTILSTHLPLCHTNKNSNIFISLPLSNFLTTSDAKTNPRFMCLSFSNPQLTLGVSLLTTHTRIYLSLPVVVLMLLVWLVTESYTPNDSMNPPSCNTWHSIWMGKRPLYCNFSFRLTLQMYLYPRHVSLYHCTIHDWATTPKSTVRLEKSY